MSPADIISRVQGFVMAPAAEWDKIEAEPADVQAIYTNYVGPLVVAAAIAIFLGLAFVGVTIGFGLKLIILQIALQLGSVYLFALVVNALAPNFGGTANFGQAFKLAAYSPTPVWVVTLVMIIPVLMPLLILGLVYSFYLLYIGLPKLMKPPADKVMIYVLASIAAMFLIGLVIQLILNAL